MPDYLLTRRAILDLENIYNHSSEMWGENVADDYLKTIYNAFDQIAKNPELGQRRKKRSFPFLMVPANKHFIVYDTFSKGIIIITLLHQVRNIEQIIQSLPNSLLNEIKNLKKQFPK